MQCPPTRPGVKGRKFHLVEAASITSLVPPDEPMPAVNVAIGLLAIVAAIGLFRSYEWARWLGVAASAVISLSGLTYLAWSLGHAYDPMPGVFYDLIEPVVGALMLLVLLRRGPSEVSGADKLP